jgi:hypothetical protein
LLTPFLSILRECFPVVPHVRGIEALAYQKVFPHPANRTRKQRTTLHEKAAMERGKEQA